MLTFGSCWKLLAEVQARSSLGRRLEVSGLRVLIAVVVIVVLVVVVVAVVVVVVVVVVCCELKARMAPRPEILKPLRTLCNPWSIILYYIHIAP